METAYLPVIAIDGPSGSGKSTIARMVAVQMQIQYIDTGALYRALGFWAHQEGVDLQQPQELLQMLEGLQLSYGQGPDCLVAINGQNLTNQIRQHHVSQLASAISRWGVIRDYLLDFQRGLAQRPAVMEGRDIGSVVFPQAFCKIFLTATPQERARRRHLELLEQGQKVDFQQLYQDLLVRDDHDSTRAIAPLRQAADAYLLDSTRLSRQEVVEKILSQAQERRTSCKVAWH